MTERDIKRIVAEALEQASATIHQQATPTAPSASLAAPKKNNHSSLLRWLIPLIVSVAIAVIGWTLYAGEKTSDSAHAALRGLVESEAASRSVEDAALTKQLDLFTSLASRMSDDIATLKAQMTILMGRMK